jgi:hypothetical protein
MEEVKLGDQAGCHGEEKNFERFRTFQRHVGEKAQARCCEKGSGKNKSMRDGIFSLEFAVMSLVSYYAYDYSLIDPFSCRP